MTRTELMEAIVHYAGDTVRARRMYRQSHSDGGAEGTAPVRGPAGGPG
jgi:hypothetical protein